MVASDFDNITPRRLCCVNQFYYFSHSTLLARTVLWKASNLDISLKIVCSVCFNWYNENKRFICTKEIKKWNKDQEGKNQDEFDIQPRFRENEKQSERKHQWKHDRGNDISAKDGEWFPCQHLLGSEIIKHHNAEDVRERSFINQEFFLLFW